MQKSTVPSEETSDVWTVNKKKIEKINTEREREREGEREREILLTDPGDGVSNSLHQHSVSVHQVGTWGKLHSEHPLPSH